MQKINIKPITFPLENRKSIPFYSENLCGSNFNFFFSQNAHFYTIDLSRSTGQNENKTIISCFTNLPFRIIWDTLYVRLHIQFHRGGQVRLGQVLDCTRPSQVHQTQKHDNTLQNYMYLKNYYESKKSNVFQVVLIRIYYLQRHLDR